jgi:hypothetical protein
MANASSNAKRTTRTVTEATGSVKLELSLYEAEFLREVMSRIGGSGETTARTYADSIAEALDDVGVDRARRYHVQPSASSIYFVDQPELIHGER